MTHPFDDFLSPQWHTQRTDQRIVKYGLCLVVLMIVSTIAAFAVSLSSWRSVTNDSVTISVKWDDAQERVYGYINAKKELRDTIKAAKQFELLLDGVPRSLILWEITQSLPHNAMIDDVRLNTRRRINEGDELTITEFVTLLGTAFTDAEISMYIESLTASEFFQNVSLQYAQEDQTGNKRNFSIHMEVKRAAMLAMEEPQ